MTWARRVEWPHVAIIIGAIFVFAFVIALGLANQRGSDRVALQQDTQESTTRQIADLTERLSKLEDEKQAASTEAEKAKAQANTSVDQLVRAGETPIIAAPDVVTVPTAPVTSLAPVPTSTTEPPTTTTTTEPPPETTTTTTEPPTTTTTTTEPPPETTTTTTTRRTTTP